VKRVDDGGTADSGESHEIVAQAQEIVEVDDVGAKVVEGRLETPTKEVVRPVGEPGVFSAVDAMIGGEALDSLASDSRPPVAGDVGRVKDPDVVGPGELTREVIAVNFRTLGGVRRKLVDHLEDA